MRILFVVVTFCTLATNAVAQRVVLVRPVGADDTLKEAFNRLRGELQMHGFEVSVVDEAEVDASAAGLAAVAEHEAAVASVTLVRTEGHAAADVWLSDRVTGKTSIRTVATTQAEDSASRLALRALELLRASLREFTPESPAPSDIVGAAPERAPPQVLNWAAESGQKTPAATSGERDWGLEAGVSALTPLPRSLWVLAPSFGVVFRASSLVSFSARATGPTTEATLMANGATADLDYALGAFGVELLVIAYGSFHLQAGAGVGAVWVGTRGSSTETWVGRRSSTVALSLGPSAAANWSFTDGWSLRLSAEAQGWLPRPVIEVGGQRFGLGRPGLMFELGVVVGF